MAYFISLQILVITIFTVGGLEGNSFETDSSLSTDCPVAEDIAPCICSKSVTGLFLDCSSIINEDQLRQVFSKVYPSSHFQKLSILNNYNIHVLGKGIFGSVTFGEIELSNGALNTLEPETLLGMAPILQNISLNSQNLSSFPIQIIPQMKILKSLSLHANYLTQFPDIHSPTLQFLRLNFNPFGHIPSTALANIPQIKAFYCDGCSLKNIIPGTFAGYKNLATVSLNYNNLTTLAEGALELHGPKASLYMYANDLVNISKGSIKGATEEIELIRNNIVYLNESIWRPVVENITIVSASENPLACDCDIGWLVVDPVLLGKLSRYTSCANGTRVCDLDPTYYEEMC